MKALVGILILSATVAGIFVLNDVTRTKDGKSVLDVAGDPEVVVELAQPQQRDIVRIVQAPGEVEPFMEVDISAEVMGKILEMPVEEGDSVKKGLLLCRLDDADYRARLTSAQASVAQIQFAILEAQADLDKAERDLDRQVRLSESDATSAIELADYNTARIQSQSRLDMRRQELIEAQARVDSTKEDLAKTVIESPIDGIVSQRFAKQGEVVITGTMNNPGTRIMVVSDLSKMQVRCRVDEGDAPLVKADQTARIYLQSDTRKSVPGHVFRVGSKGTKQEGRDVVSFETLVLVDSDDPRVKPGMTASIEIEVSRREGTLTVPVEAVVTRKRKDLSDDLVKQFDAMQAKIAVSERARAAEYIKLLFRSDDMKAKPCVIETGINDEARVEVLSGISAEDMIVTGPYRSLDQLKDGSRLKLDEKKDDDKKMEESDEAKVEEESNKLADAESSS